MPPLALPPNPISGVLGAAPKLGALPPNPVQNTLTQAAPALPHGAGVGVPSPIEVPTDLTPIATRISLGHAVTPDFVQQLQQYQKADPSFQTRLNAEIARVTGNIEAKRNSGPLAIAGQMVESSVDPFEWPGIAVGGAKQLGRGVGELSRGQYGKGFENVGLGALGTSAALPFAHIGGDAIRAAADIARGETAGHVLLLGKSLAGKAAQSDLLNHVVYDDRGEIAPFHFFPSEKTAANLRAKLSPRGVQTAASPLETTLTKDGTYAYGGTPTPEQWVDRVTKMIPNAAERHAGAQWYTAFEPLFRKAFPPEIADKIMRAFAVSQANASPVGGLASSILAHERIAAGEEVGSIGSVVADNIEKAIKGMPIDQKVAAKLSDFIDALRGERTRTWMGHDVRGGAPTPIDIWGQRDLGHVDRKLLTKGTPKFMQQTHGLDLGSIDRSKLTPPGASGARYERLAEKYGEITDHLNTIGFDGRNDWTPAETQALGWHAIQKFYGKNPDTFEEAVNKGPLRARAMRNRQIANAARDTNASQAGTDLAGLPKTVRLHGVPVEWHSNGPLQDIAHEYMAGAGLHYEPPSVYARVDPLRAERIAQWYDQATHAPEDPAVRASYEAMANETKAQYDALTRHGYRFEFYPKDHDPYPGGPREAVLDVIKNKHAYVFPTDEGFGTLATETQHPLLADSGVRWNGQTVTHNDLFRAVHDVFGHAKEGVGFRADGEENAWRSHSAMYSAEARKAMTSETRGQNSWVNYGPHGETNRTASQLGTVYADQKAVIPPDWVVNEGAGDAGVSSRTAQQRLNAVLDGFVRSEWKPEGNITAKDRAFAEQKFIEWADAHPDVAEAQHFNALYNSAAREHELKTPSPESLFHRVLHEETGSVNLGGIANKIAEHTIERPTESRSPEEAAAHVQAAADQAVLEGHGPNATGALGSVPRLEPGQVTPETGGELGARFRAALNGKLPEGMGTYEKVGAQADRLDKSVNVLRKEQQAQRSVEVARRAGLIKEHLEAGNLEGARAARAGKLPAVQFHGFDHFTPDEVKQLQDTILQNDTLHPYEKVRAADAIDEARAGKVPTKSEQRLFARVFGQERNAAPIEDGTESKTPAWLKTVTDIANIPRSMMAGMDLSSPFRQALVAGARHPVLFGKAFKPMVKSIASDAYFEEHVHDAIVNDPSYPLMHKMGIAFTEIAHDAKDANAREEMFMSNYAQRYLGPYSKVLLASNRGFVGFLNILRANIAKNVLQQAAEAGWDVNDTHLLESLGSVINSSTGRGSLGALQNHAASLNALFFAPKLLASRLNFLGFGGYNDIRGAIPGSYYMSLHPVARMEAWRGIMGTALLGATLLGLAKAGGASVSLNTNSADFAKIKVGNTRIDVLGGFQQVLKLASVLATGKSTSSLTGVTKTLGSGFGSATRFDEVLKFLEGKLSPIPSFMIASLKGKDFTGQPVKWNQLSTWEQAAGRSLTPFIAQDLWNLYGASGKWGLLGGFPALVGFGTTAYKGKGGAPTGGWGSGGGSAWDTSNSNGNSAWGSGGGSWGG